MLRTCLMSEEVSNRQVVLSHFRKSSKMSWVFILTFNFFFQALLHNFQVHSSFPDNLKQITKKRIEANLAETEICDCHKRDNPCDEECTNRQLQNECSSKCLNGDKCQNRRFTKRHYPPLLKFQTDWGGNGLKAKKLIPKGSFIIEYIGEIISHDESRIRLEESAKIGVTNYYILELDNVRQLICDKFLFIFLAPDDRCWPKRKHRKVYQPLMRS